MYTRSFRVLFFAAFGAALSACSGGGGGGQSPVTPPISNPPAPTPTPTPNPPAPPDYDTQEYRNQPALEQVNALAAYDEGASGEGVIVAIVDTGIDLNNPEFDGRVHPDSADLVIAGVVPPGEARSTPTLQDEDDHGTPVASIIAAARDEVAVHGVAPEATLLVFRGDDDSVDDPIIYGQAISEGVERAVNAGAGVFNFSLGSDDAGVRSDFSSLFSYTAANDIVSVIAVGNDGNPDPQQSALGALDATGNAAIVVGAVNSNNQITSYSNRAGEAADIFLVAPGQFIPTIRVGTPVGQTEFFSGTSASTPHVAGAAALIRDLWPTLSADEVVEILLESATDLGDPGTDAVYGRGLLNIGAAVQPSGATTMSMPDGASISAESISAQLSPVFGASLASIGDVIVFDRYDRDFRMNLGAHVSSFAPETFDVEQWFSPYDSHRYASKMIAPSLTMQMRLSSRDLAYRDMQSNFAASFTGADATHDVGEDKLALAMTGVLGDGAHFTMAHGFTASAGERMAITMRDTPFLSASAFKDGFFPQSGEGLTAIVQTTLSDRMTADMVMTYGEEADAYAAENAIDPEIQTSPDVVVMRTGLNYRLDGATFRLEHGVRREEGAILNARFDGDASATTVYGSVEAQVRLSAALAFKGRYAAGYTMAQTDGFGGVISDFSGLMTTQFSFGLVGDGLLLESDRFWLGVSQPLQVESGAAHLVLPTSFDKWTEELSFSTVKAPLDFHGRRLDFEAGYRFEAGPLGRINLNVIHQTFGGLDLPEQTSVVLRNGVSF